MTSPYQRDNKLICPKCKKSNDLHAEYCWGCYFDFVPNAPNVKKEPTPKSRAGSGVLAHILFPIFMLILSGGILYGSWVLYHGLYPHRSARLFVLGWVVLLVLVEMAEKQLPDPDPNLWEYYSLNPFNFQDNYNRFVLGWHIILFLPRIVSITIKMPLLFWKEYRNRRPQ